MSDCNNCIHTKVCSKGLKMTINNASRCPLFEQERPHGEWVEVGYTEDYHEAKYRCTNCKTEYKYTDFISIAPVECFPNFCPICGSDNRREGEAE